MAEFSEEIEDKALELWRRGIPLEAIMKNFGFPSSAAVLEACRAAMGRRPEVTERDRRLLELQRLDIAADVTMRAVAQGDLKAVDRLTKIYETRQKMELVGDDIPARLLDAFRRSVAACDRVDEEKDAALITAGEKLAARIDRALQYGSSQDATKAIYLSPHLTKILDKLLATPASRAEVEKVQSEQGSRLAALREEWESRRGG